jgi:hypothetical protein
MEIEPITFATFASRTSCIGVISNSAKEGCAWYAASDARAFGRIYFYPADEAFGFGVLYFALTTWRYEKSPNAFEMFDDAEEALLTEMSRVCGRKTVTVQDTPMRLRFGRGRNRSAIGEAKSY